MSANRHATDANSEALRLHLAIQSLCEQSALGKIITSEQVEALLSASASVRYHAARTMFAATLFGAPDRREQVVAIATTDIPTPLAALEALLAECENTLDYRTPFRCAMSNAHAAIFAAKKPRVMLEGTIVLGERIELGDDEELTFAELFGEPDPIAFNPAVLEIARAIAATDGTVAVRDEVAHG